MNEEIVCHCMAVSKAEIIAAIKNGANNIDKIIEQTGAGSGCGGCHIQINELIAQNK